MKAMLLIGAIMAGADLKTMVTKITVIFSVIRLALIPLAVFAGYHGVYGLVFFCVYAATRTI